MLWIGGTIFQCGSSSAGPTTPAPQEKILAFALIITAFAASAQAVIIGVSIGYLTDSKDTYFAARAGIEFSTAGSFAATVCRTPSALVVGVKPKAVLNFVESKT